MNPIFADKFRTTYKPNFCDEIKCADFIHREHCVEFAKKLLTPDKFGRTLAEWANITEIGVE